MMYATLVRLEYVKQLAYINSNGRLHSRKTVRAHGVGRANSNSDRLAIHYRNSSLSSAVAIRPIRTFALYVPARRTHVESRRTAGSSTALRSGRDDNHIGRRSLALPNGIVVPSETAGVCGAPLGPAELSRTAVPTSRSSFSRVRGTARYPRLALGESKGKDGVSLVSSC